MGRKNQKGDLEKIVNNISALNDILWKIEQEKQKADILQKKIYSRGRELKFEELSYEEAKKVRGSLLELQKMLNDKISIRRENASHGKRLPISYICYNLYIVLVGCQMI